VDNFIFLFQRTYIINNNQNSFSTDNHTYFGSSR